MCSDNRTSRKWIMHQREKRKGAKNVISFNRMAWHHVVRQVESGYIISP